MATAYHRDQAGAPALVYSTVSAAVAQFAALKAILKACLVTGYGALPAAGWSLINEGTNFIVLRNGSHTGYVCLTWVTGGTVRVYLAETYTGMSGDVMTGDGLKTGVAANNLTPHSFSAWWFAYSSAMSSWCMVADSKTFVLSVISSSTNYELNGTNIGSFTGLTLYVGEDSEGNFIAAGGDNNAVASGSSQLGYFSAETGFTALKNPATGLLVGAGSLVVSSPGLPKQIASAAFVQVAVYPFARLDLGRAMWSGGGVYAGLLRGLALTPQLSSYSYASNAAQCLGFSGAMTIRTANTPIDLADGYTYFVRTSYHLVHFFLITDNPGFW